MCKNGSRLKMQFGIRSPKHDDGLLRELYDMKYISVVRDFDMYDRCVRRNPNNCGAQFVWYDNNVENVPIPVRYNLFLDDCRDCDDWLVFCHEDFQFCEPLEWKLSSMDKGAIYGVFGARLAMPGVGLQVDSNKDGSDASFRGSIITKATLVDTVDCACLIVHSSLVLRYGLRFDENLTYDLYTEDFGISAHERFGVKTYVLPIKSHHYSYGNIMPRFYEQLDYLNRKYSDASCIYVTTTSYAIGRSDKLNEILALLRSRHRIPFKWLFYKKISHSGRLIIKILGIPIWNSRKFSCDSW